MIDVSGVRFPVRSSGTTLAAARPMLQTTARSDNFQKREANVGGKSARLKLASERPRATIS